MKFLVKSALLTATAIGSTFTVAAPALAQNTSANDAASDVIIVTARKKEESLLDAPLAVSVVSEAELTQAGFVDITEVTKATPGAFVEPTGQNVNGIARINSTPRFRGISVLNGDPLNQTATVFLDGIYLSGGAETIGVNELARVEVIKGPQSALFGRNTFAGAINYVTKDPSDEFQADIAFSAATRDEYTIAAGVEGPLTEGLSFRLSGNFSDKQGHYDNVAVDGQRLGDEQQWSITGALLIEPADNIRLKLRGSYQEIEDGPSAGVLSYGTRFHNFGGFLTDANDVFIPGTGVQPAFGDDRTESVYRGIIERPANSQIGLNSARENVEQFRGFLNDGRSDPGDAIFGFKYNPTTVDDFGLNLDALRLSAQATVGLTDNVEFSFLGGYNKENFGFFSDFDTSPGLSFTGFTARETEDFTLEGRLSTSLLDDALNLSIGASYVQIDIDELGGAASFFGPSIFFGDIFRTDPFSTGAKTLGIFGSADLDITDQLSVTLEGRWQEDEIREDEANLGREVSVSPTTITSFLPRATVRYRPTSNTTLYATYSEGNLPGGFNGQVAQLDDAQLAQLAAQAPDARLVYGEEKLTNYELGWKQQTADGKLAFNVAAFYMKRDDEIFNSIETVDDPTETAGVRTVNFLSNGASTDIYGIEIDASLRLADNFTAQASFAYVDSTIASFPEGAGSGDFGDIFGQGSDVTGQQAPRFPPVTWSFGGTYENDFNAIPGFDRWFVRSDVFYTGKYYISNANVAQVQQAVDVNARFGLRGDDFGIEFFVLNVFNEDAPTTAQNFADVGLDTRTLPGGFFNFSREGARIGLRDKRQFGIRLNATIR